MKETELVIGNRYVIVNTLHLEVIVTDDFIHEENDLERINADRVLRYQGKVHTFPWPLYKFQSMQTLKQAGKAHEETYVVYETVLLGENQLRYLELES